jgi:hypothetical protein
MKSLCVLLVLCVAVVVCLPSLLPPGARAAESLPAEISDSDYWKMVSEFSEPNGYFQYDIVTSNETAYQFVLPALMKTAKTGGAYLGVGPEQNFTYIAALQPKIAFIIDIRRDMMLEHLMYKAVFEMSENRADFVSNLFSRKRPANLAADAPVRTLFQAYSAVAADRTFAEERFKAIMNRLKTGHHFPITAEDETRMRTIYMTFLREGVVSFAASFRSPGYAALMLATDSEGKNWSYLSDKGNYDRVRALQQKNLIVPLVGDFAGPKAIRMTGQYLKEHGAIANVFYISNVEDYIQSAWPAYAANIASLPIDSSSVFVRWAPGTVPTLVSIRSFNGAQFRPR